MSKLDRQALVAAVANILKPAGFTKRGDSWYADTGETVQVVNLQKSAWGEQYYVNLAVCVKALADRPYPKEHQCHVRIRLTSLPGVDRAAFEQALKLDTGGDDARTNAVHEALAKYGLPFLQSLGTLDGLGTAIRSGQLEAAIVHKGVRELVETRGG